MSGIIVDRALLHLQSQSTELRPGDAFVSVIFEIGASGFHVRLKSRQPEVDRSADTPGRIKGSVSRFHTRGRCKALLQ